MTAVSNLVFQRSKTAGSGALTLSAVSGRQGFFQAFGSGGTDAFFYFISHRTKAEWEVGTGHMSDAATLQRDTVIASSAGGAKVAFSAGDKDVVNDVPASMQAGLVTLAGDLAALEDKSFNALQDNPGVPLGQGRRLVLLGDSITRINADTNGSGTRSCTHGARGAMTWAQVRLGFPFYCPMGYNAADHGQPIGFNAGKGGDTAAGMRARLETDVLSLSPDYVYLMAGTNDIAGGRTYAQISDDLAYIIDTCIARGATVIVEPILPRTAAGNWASAAQRKLHLKLNNFLRAKAASARGMILVDTASRIVDQSSATGDGVAAYFADGVHPTIRGGFWRGDAIVEALQGRFPDPYTTFSSPADVYDATDNPQGNWLANGHLAGTGGTAGTGISGSLADSWQALRASGSTLTAVASKTAAFTAGENTAAAQKFVITSTGGGSGMERITFSPTTENITSGISTGDWFEFDCRIRVDAPVYTSGSGGIQAIYLNLCDTTDSGGSSTIAQCLSNLYAASATHGTFPDVGWRGVLKTPPLQLRGTTGLRTRVYIELDSTKAFTLALTLHSMRVRRLAAAPFTYSS